jgi:hypothetical protein
MPLQHTKELEALESIQKELEAKAITPADVCATYKKIKPWLTTALTLVGAIPVYGNTIAGVIKLLMGIADNFCK